MINIIGMKKIFFIISSIIILIGLSTMLISGLNEDIDFAGGTAMHINIGRTFDNDEIADSVSEAIQVEPSSVQKVGDGTEVIIKTKVIDTIQRDKVFQVLKEKYELKQEDLFSTDNVDPTIGKELRSQAFLASIIASVLMLLYITFRFEFKSGIAAVIGLLHDVLIMLTVYAVFRVPVNTSFIAAILTILGYSINDTIIVFDRIRENRKLMKKESFTAVVNKSILQTMSRSINTSVTTLITIAALYIVGVQSIKEFAFPIIIGILSGTYSSIVIASPIWVTWREWQENKKSRLRNA